MAQHCMIDIETWGKGPTAQIVSLGAVKFDPADPEGPFDNFHVAIDPAAGGKAFRALFEVDPGTVMWWMSKDRTLAREHWLSCEKLDLPSALVGFSEWFGPNSMPTWGNGATFDNVILLHALGACGFDRPWTYRHDRCYRTLRAEWSSVPFLTEHEMAEMLVAAPLRRVGSAGVPHTALYDAQAQAMHLCRIYAVKDHARELMWSVQIKRSANEMNTAPPAAYTAEMGQAFDALVAQQASPVGDEVHPVGFVTVATPATDASVRAILAKEGSVYDGDLIGDEAHPEPPTDMSTEVVNVEIAKLSNLLDPTRRQTRRYNDLINELTRRALHEDAGLGYVSASGSDGDAYHAARADFPGEMATVDELLAGMNDDEPAVDPRNADFSGYTARPVSSEAE